MLNPIPRRRPRKPLPAVVAAVIAAGLMALAGGAPAFAADDPTIGISARPGDATGASDGRTRFSYQVDPGQQVDDQVVIVNTGTDSQHFTVFGTDAYSDAEGNFGLLPTEQPPVTVGSWVRFENGEGRIEFDLLPGEGRVVPFRVEVPPQAPPGDQAGGIVASVLTEGGQVSVDRRVAVRLYTRISGDLQPMLTISDVRAEHHGDWWNLLGGGVTLHYTVTNTGNVALAANATRTVGSWFGIEAAPSDRSTVEEILPGYSREIVEEIPDVAQWGYLVAGVKLNPYVDDSVNQELQLTVAATSRDATFFAVPWLVLIAIGIVVIIVLILRWRRWADQRRAEAWAAYQEAQAKEPAQQAITVGAGEAAHGG